MNNELNKDLGIVFWIEPHNKMEGKFKLFGVGDSDLNAKYISRIGRYSDLNSTLILRAYEESDVESTFRLMYRNESTIDANVLARVSNSLDSILSIRPHNQMFGLIDIIEPIRVNETLTPNKDAFVRSSNEYKYLNYGNATSMSIGYIQSSDDILKSYISFDLSKYDSNYVFEDAKLRLYYIGSISNIDNIKLSYADRNWKEDGITYANRPLAKELVADKYTINTNEGYIEFSILDSIVSIIEKDRENFGFILESDNSLKQDIFFTRESSRPPELNIRYFDTRVPSTGRSELNGTALFIGIGNSDLNSHLTIHTDYAETDINATLWLHRYDTPESKDFVSKVSSSQPDLNATAFFYRVGNGDLESTLRVYEYTFRDAEASIDVITPDLNSTFATGITSYLDSYVDIRETYDVNAYFNTMQTSMLNSTLAIRRNEYADTSFVLSSNKPDINATLLSRSYGESDLSSFVYIYGDKELFVEANVGIGYPELNIKLRAKAIGEDDLSVTLISRALRNKDVDSCYGASTPELNAHLLAHSASWLDSVAILNNPELYSRMTSRAYKENDLSVTLRPKVIGINDLNSYIRVINKQQSGSYYYII